MSISAYARHLQLLFPLLAGVFFCTTAFAQHKLVLKNRSVREGEIVGASATTVQLKVAQGTVGIPKIHIAEIVMPIPVNFTKGMEAWQAGDAGQALGLIRPLAETYKGLPTDWAQQAVALLGDLYIVSNDLASAEKAYQDLQTLYPDSESKSADVGMARIAISKKDFATAKSKLEPIASEAMTKKSVTRLEGASYGQTFLLMGEINEAQGNYSEALEDYLRTVTLFHHDAKAVQLAQEKADALRKSHPVHVP